MGEERLAEELAKRRHRRQGGSIAREAWQRRMDMDLQRTVDRCGGWAAPTTVRHQEETMPSLGPSAVRGQVRQQLFMDAGMAHPAVLAPLGPWETRTPRDGAVEEEGNGRGSMVLLVPVVKDEDQLRWPRFRPQSMGYVLANSAHLVVDELREQHGIRCVTADGRPASPARRFDHPITCLGAAWGADWLHLAQRCANTSYRDYPSLGGAIMHFVKRFVANRVPTKRRGSVVDVMEDRRSAERRRFEVKIRRNVADAMGVSKRRASHVQKTAWKAQFGHVHQTSLAHDPFQSLSSHPTS